MCFNYSKISSLLVRHLLYFRKKELFIRIECICEFQYSFYFFSCNNILDGLDLNSELNPPDWLHGEWAKVRNNGDLFYNREIKINGKEICKEGLFEIENCSFPLNSISDYRSYYVDEDSGDDFYRINLIPINDEEHNFVKAYFKLIDENTLVLTGTGIGREMFKKQ